MQVGERLREWAGRRRIERAAQSEDVFADLREIPERELPELAQAVAIGSYGHVDTRWRDATKYIDLSPSVLDLEAITRASRLDDDPDDGLS